MISLLGNLKSGSSSKKYVNFFLLLPPCRLQKKNYLGTWKKVPPLLSSWSFWVTGLTFMTLKGLVAVHLSFSFLLNLYQSTPSQIHHTHSVTWLLIGLSFKWIILEKKRKTLECPDICGGMVRVIDRADKTPLSVHKRWMRADRPAALRILPILMLLFCLPHSG